MQTGKWSLIKLNFRLTSLAKMLNFKNFRKLKIQILSKNEKNEHKRVKEDKLKNILKIRHKINLFHNN